MKATVKTLNPKTHRSNCLIVGIFDDAQLSATAQSLDEVSKGFLTEVLSSGDLQGKAGQTMILHNVPNIKAERIILVGCGERDKLDGSGFIKILKKVFALLKSTKAKDVTCCLGEIDVNDKDFSWKTIQSVRIAGETFYSFDAPKKDGRNKRKLSNICFSASSKTQASLGSVAAKRGLAIVSGMQVTRDLGNLPANYCTPSYLAEQGKDIAKKYSTVKARVLTEANMEKLGMGSLLSVSRGSVEPAKMIVLQYDGRKAANKKASDKPYVLVGKGVTFDTGGISIKPSGAMDEMKFDMCGAASVLGTMVAVAEMRLPIQLVVLVPATENMPGGKATKPGDVVTSMSGQTIEVLNTDAEGRLILCDALTYAERFKPEAVIDVATLTGACIIALGRQASGLLSNNDELAGQLLEAGNQCGDRAWRLPIWDEYQTQLDSNFADMANIGGRDAGTITAACFLSRFAKKFDWAHLDIAGTAWLSGKSKGATGRPVSLLVQYLMDRSE